MAQSGLGQVELASGLGKATCLHNRFECQQLAGFEEISRIVHLIRIFHVFFHEINCTFEKSAAATTNQYGTLASMRQLLPPYIPSIRHIALWVLCGLLLGAALHGYWLLCGVLGVAVVALFVILQ
jgi:mannose/fructose/N-acetylgalactosamine-specific phosphotransferase system component IID